MAGDIAVNFAPPQASAPWAVAKAMLRIPVKQSDQMAALAGTVQWFTRIVRRGQLYELLYNAKTTDGNAVLNLHDALLDVYVAAIELLTRCDSLIEGGMAKQTLNAILRPEQATGLVADLFQKEQKLLQEVAVCEASRSEIAGRQADEKSRDLLFNVNKLSSPLARVDEGVMDIREMIDEDRLRGLLQFISPEGHGKSHVDIADSRIDDTGNWLMEHEGFRAWQAIPSSSTILWLKGTVGTGKTYLTWRAIEYVKATLEEGSGNEGFAFFYCSRSATSLQDPLVILRSFVRQLFDKASETGYNRLIQKRKVAENEGRSLGLKDCKELILELINLYSKSTIILDALDEASSTSTNQNLAEILIGILDKAKKPVKLFISSRPDREYLQAFKANATITIESNNQQADIEKYLEDRLYSTLSFKQRQKETQTLILNVFSSKNSTMFRWIHLQVQRLNNYTSHDAVRSWATTLPSTLTEAYDQLFDDMRKHDEHDIALAERAIKWVLCSILPLSSEALLEAIRYSLHGSVVVQKDKQTEQQILSLCRDLLTIEPKRKVWALPHASVAEYFELKGITLAECDLFASKILIDCLVNFEPETLKRVARLWPVRSFEQYVVYAWFLHVERYDKWLGSAKGANADPGLVMALKRFLGSPEESSDYYRRWIDNADTLIDKGRRYHDGRIGYSVKTELLPSDMALYTVCRYGFYYTLRDWWEGTAISKEMALKECKLGYTPLVHAVKSGCIPILKHLISLGGTDYSPSERCNAFGSPLIAAACVLNIQSVEILLKAGANADVSVECGKYDTALDAAASSYVFDEQELVEIVQLLLDSGADANKPLKKGRYGSALETLICLNFDDINILREPLGMLLKAGADPTMVFERGHYGSALAAAAFHGLKELLVAMIGATSKERAVECLRFGRHPDKCVLGLKKTAEKWRDGRVETVKYLADEVGVDEETLHKIGLWDVTPEMRQGEYYIAIF
ncbi:hypothetical protein TRIATDRAFT_235024 [Trichoderma atroviride IMI 206040]|uniref:Nephrocystin 3-like N-terminal domain-containing protein n=1 Tax=Hypocrea atroviridis (strain ATCC 20476 / IMI 206040) TaxID=452589 RepID=G9NIE2_HYPAI|nr:uncharacterized protein TRIATDRAFT_235024 [Trichoderma atroviride IMI 206040]EHK49555.1 hypothetical protein TRIATDRAFT_235024 [Trichoderma atroviride IMI 206040]